MYAAVGQSNFLSSVSFYNTQLKNCSDGWLQYKLLYVTQIAAGFVS